MSITVVKVFISKDSLYMYYINNNMDLWAICNLWSGQSKVEWYMALSFHPHPVKDHITIVASIDLLQTGTRNICVYETDSSYTLFSHTLLNKYCNKRSM